MVRANQPIANGEGKTFEPSKISIRINNISGGPTLQSIGATNTLIPLSFSDQPVFRNSNFPIRNGPNEFYKQYIFSFDIVISGGSYLEALKTYKEGFDIIITCTGSIDPILTNDRYTSLLAGEKEKKVIVDLAIPNDVATEVIANNHLDYIEIKTLQDIADQNLKERYQELINGEAIIEQNIKEFRPILKQRRVEIAMKEVPEKIKEIRSRALNDVFANEINTLDDNSRQVLEKVMAYMEKKYISVPMVIAKDILVKNS